ncbi:MAG TPA: GH25 family lysozyme [Eggerthellaceae bacterium]|nr:GH25 family lysozyme [Eggerthellaceae bacterium]
MQTATLSKKVVSVLLSLALIFSFTPTLAFAENSNLGENSANQNTAEEGSSTGANDNALNDSENQGNNSASGNSSNQTANNDNSSDSSNIDSGTGLVRSNEVNQKGTTDNPADQQDSASEEAAETNNNEANDQANSWRFIDGDQIYSYEGASTDGGNPGVSLFAASPGASSHATWYKSNGTTSYTYKAEPDDAGQNISVSGAKRVGIDVSYHNGTIDWAKVKNSGVSFAIIRCGYGSDFTNQDDVKFFENVRGAQENGIDIGIYLYSYAMNTTGNDSSAASEARHVLRLLDEAGLEPNDLAYPVFFDMEESKQLDLGSKKLGELASTFCNAISAEGYEVGIYSNLNWWSNYLTDSAFDNSNWHKWAARYPGSNKATSSGVPGTEIWQFSDCGHVDGVNGNVDMNFDYVNGYSSPLRWDSNGLRYLKKDGSYASDELITYDGNTYYFNSDTYAHSGWKTINNSTYYFKSDTKVRLTGWQRIYGEYYYFKSDTAALMYGLQKIYGNYYYLDPDTGARYEGWLDLDGSRYYFDDVTGVQAIGWTNIDGESYYFKSDTAALMYGMQKIWGEYYYLDPDTGARYEGWLDIDGKRCYFKSDTGAMLHGWQRIWMAEEERHEEYYFKSDTGAMMYGLQRIWGEYYYLDPDTGARYEGWLDLDGKRYYFKSDTGARLTGWQRIYGEYYYFKSDTAALMYGLQKIYGNYYYLDPDTGARYEGWLDLDGKRYYFKSDTGVRLTGWQRIYGEEYYFDSETGECLTC